MRPIHLAQLDKTRPVVVLTREAVRPHLSNVTVAPITTTVRGLSSEAPVGPANGLDQAGVVSCDNIQTIPTDRLGRHLGFLFESQELALAAAISAAFDLEPPRPRR
ncbi:MAG: type II toxin-antitoxin system PemK/MazF family toxin [Bifidobacteriaceae bacterium]|nr:type II toxin-antitoxin system PemK/MazF family toxin [Bifidobacteriaceae bacterium]